MGPGAVLVGLAIGAGELVVWPILTARFGAGIAWGAMIGIVLQLVINLEVARYTLATGQSAYGAFAKLGRVWVPVFLTLNVLGWILPGWARTCAGAVKALAVGANGPGEPWLWTALTFVGVAAVMFGPKNVYQTIERITIGLVVVMLAGLLVIASQIADVEAIGALARGIFNVGFKPDALPLYELFSGVVFAGAGGTTNLVLAYYLINKDWGMGAHTSERGAGQALQFTDTNDNRRRWSRWQTLVRRDQVLFFWIMNSITILLFILSALVVLHAEGIVPSREMLLLQEAAILEKIWGSAGATLFMLVGICCLFSTQLTLLDGIARSAADLVDRIPSISGRWTYEIRYRVTAVAWMIVGVILTWAWGKLPPFMFLLSAGFFGGIAMAIYCPLLLIANRRLEPELCRPGPVASALFAAVSLVYVLFAACSIWVVGVKLFSA